MIFTYNFHSDEIFQVSSWYYFNYGIIVNDYNVTDLYVGY